MVRPGLGDTRRSLRVVLDGWIEWNLDTDTDTGIVPRTLGSVRLGELDIENRGRWKVLERE
jgi:hypothetical protein